MLEQLQKALTQIQEMQRRVVENQMFHGWSGRARMICGLLAILTPAVLGSEAVPPTPPAHLLGWGILCGLAGVITAGALAFWFVRDPAVGRDWRKLRPTLQIFPPLAVGAVLTLAAIAQEQYDWLFGIWMLCFGLSNLAARRVLPRSIALVGLFYLGAGTGCLLSGASFLNPWPMGAVFGFGEIAGGLILHLDKRRKIT